MVVLGYALILAFVVGLILFSEKVLSGRIAEEYCRKVLHIGAFAVLPVGNVFLGAGSIHFVVICAVFSVATLYLYFGKQFKTIDKREKSYPGIFYYALSLTALATVCFFFPEYAPFFNVAFIGLALGDGFATLIGYTFKGPRIYKNKTYIGFFACFAATAGATLLNNLVSGRILSVPDVLLLSLLAATVELVDLGLDNIVIPFSLFGAAICLLHFPAFSFSLLVFEGVFAVAFFLRVIDYYGSLLAAAIGCLFYTFGGLSAFLFVVGCYLVMLTVSVVGKLLKNDLSSVVRKTGKKDLTEVFANGAWATVAILLFAVTQHRVFLVLSLVSMSAGFVDSLASDIGTLSKKTPYDLLRRTRVQKGVSGGVTLLGSVASAIGAVGFAVAIKLLCSLPWFSVFVIAGFLYVGCIADTVLGSLLQVKYRCVVCGRITEKETHCETQTQYERGIKHVNNDTVNLLSGFVVFLLSFSLFWIL